MPYKTIALEGTQWLWTVESSCHERRLLCGCEECIHLYTLQSTHAAITTTTTTAATVPTTTIATIVLLQPLQ